MKKSPRDPVKTQHRRPSWLALSPQEASCHRAVGRVTGRGQACSWGWRQGKFCKQTSHGGCWDIHSDVMGTEGGLVKPRDMNPSNLSPLLSPVSPGMRAGGDDSVGWGRAEPRPESRGQAFHRDAQTTR